MSLINTNAVANISNATMDYSPLDVYHSLNAAAYGLTKSLDGSLTWNTKAPIYMLGEQLRLLTSKTMAIFSSCFSLQAIRSIDRTFTRAITILPGAAAEIMPWTEKDIQQLNVQKAFTQPQFDRLCNDLRSSPNISGVVVLAEKNGLTCFFKMSHQDLQNLQKEQLPGEGVKIAPAILSTGTTSIKAGIYSTNDRVGFIVLPHENSAKKLLHYDFKYKVIGDLSTKESAHAEGSTIYTQGGTYLHTANTHEEGTVSI